MPQHIWWTRCVHAQLIQCARAFSRFMSDAHTKCTTTGWVRPRLPSWLRCTNTIPPSSAIFSAASRYAEKCSERQLFVYSGFENIKKKKKKENSCTLCLSDLHRFSRLTRKSSNNKQATKTWQLPSHDTAGVKAWQRGGGRNWTLPDKPSFTESCLANLYKKRSKK